jgi:hypothetical protein
VRLRRPGLCEFRSKGDQREHRQALDALDHEPDQFLRGRVAPVHVLVGEQHRLRRREPVQLVDQRFQRQLLPTLRAQLGQRGATLCRQAEQRRNQRHRLVQPVAAAREQRLELGQSGVGRIARRKAGGALQLRDHGVQRAGRVMRRALVEQAQMRLALEPFTHLAHETRLADARFARQEHHLALAVFDLLPAAQQQRELLRSPDQRCQTGALARLEAPFGSALARDPERRERLREAFEPPGSEIVELEQTAD